MQGKHASKMSLGFAFALLLTLQIFQLGSTQTTSPLNEKLTPLPFSGMPDEWKRVNSLNQLEEEAGINSGFTAYSGDDEYQADNQTVTAVTGQNDDNRNTTPSPQTTHSVTGNPVNTTATSVQENNTINLVTLNPSMEPSATSGSDVNLTETNTTSPNPGNSTTPTTPTPTNTTTTTAAAAGFNFTQTSTVSGNFTSTSPSLLGNYTNSPSENSTNTSVITTTTMLSNTSVVVLNESSTASTTKTNGTGGFLDVRGNMDRGLSSDNQQQSKSQAWGAILGIGVAVAIVALVVYVIVKRRNYRDFSHRKLVEDVPPEPVLRLDNSEPLDLKFDGFAYYNPGVQGDNIQMTSFPQGQTK